jgi:hypothetical protein
MEKSLWKAFVLLDRLQSSAGRSGAVNPDTRVRAWRGFVWHCHQISRDYFKQ